VAYVLGHCRQSVGHSDELGTGHLSGEHAGVHAADAAGPEHADS
jgi:hypothetical protein